jgi:hypothetical protein
MGCGFAVLGLVALVLGLGVLGSTASGHMSNGL